MDILVKNMVLNQIAQPSLVGAWTKPHMLHTNMSLFLLFIYIGVDTNRKHIVR